MSSDSIKKTWIGHFSGAADTLTGLQALGGVASVFNANIDAVLKVTPQKLAAWMDECGLSPQDVENSERGTIGSKAQLFKGLLDCWERGAAQEWLVTDEQVYAWMQDQLGYDHLQMGGQGGIIANVMAVCGVERVYVHAASLAQQQSRLFLDRPNLFTGGSDGSLVKAHDAARDDAPLIHWILEFDKGAVLEWKGKTWTCPKSNRFIATYDPLNFRLHVDPGFDKALSNKDNPLRLVLLSGYQMLSENLPGGEKGLDRIEDSWKSVSAWKQNHPGTTVHFEFASTQDEVIRKALAQGLATRVDSVGLNEQETVQVLDVIGEGKLADECRADLHSVNLFKGTLAVFKHLGVPRVQLHMFGLYLTLLRKDLEWNLPAQRAGMALAATVAAAKAGTGSIEKEENLMWAHGREVADVSLKELADLDAYLKSQFGAEGLLEEGIAQSEGFIAVALPTILIEKPVTLVGMGDTISSLSLAGSLI